MSKFSQSARIGGADRFLGRVLRELSTRADGILVVDDDLARRGDPGLDRASFIDDRVIRWGDLHSEPRDLTGLIRTGASGYPLNAFVCGSGDRQAFRPPVGPLSESEVALLARQVQVVIHSIYDAESFLLLAIDDKADSLLASLTRTQAEFGEVDENRVSGSPGI
ncbi:MAG: hypothetical protein P0Y60_17920 [Candidatus Microbacterium colombiense]|nr:MAG: hypothetical protein P0Y60_17920 [Microbacterium sp.]